MNLVTSWVSEMKKIMKVRTVIEVRVRSKQFISDSVPAPVLDANERGVRLVEDQGTRKMENYVNGIRNSNLHSLSCHQQLVMA